MCYGNSYKGFMYILGNKQDLRLKEFIRRDCTRLLLINISDERCLCNLLDNF